MATASSERPIVAVTNGRCEFRAAGGGVLVLADPPEAGWRIQRPAAKRVDADPEPLIVPRGEPGWRQAMNSPAHKAAVDR